MIRHPRAQGRAGRGARRSSPPAWLALFAMAFWACLPAGPGWPGGERDVPPAASAQTPDRADARRALEAAVRGAEDSVPPNASPYGKLFLAALLNAAWAGTVFYTGGRALHSPASYGWGTHIAMAFGDEAMSILQGVLFTGEQPVTFETVLRAETEEEIYTTLIYELQRAAKTDPELARSAAGQMRREVWRIRALTNIGHIGLLNGNPAAVQAFEEAVRVGETSRDAAVRARAAQYVCHGLQLLHRADPGTAKRLAERCQPLAAAASLKSDEGWMARLWYSQAAALTGLTSAKKALEVFPAGASRAYAAAMGAGNLAPIDSVVAQAFLDEAEAASWKEAGALGLVLRWAQACVSHAKNHPEDSVPIRAYALLAEFCASDPSGLPIVVELFQAVMKEQPDLARELLTDSTVRQVYGGVHGIASQAEQIWSATTRGSVAEKLIMKHERLEVRDIADDMHLQSWDTAERLTRALWEVDPELVNVARGAVFDPELAIAVDAALLHSGVDADTRQRTRARVLLKYRDLLLREGMKPWPARLGKHIAERLAPVAPADAMEVLAQLAPEDLRLEAYSTAAVALAQTDPEGALALLAGCKPQGPALHTARRFIASVLVSRDQRRWLPLFEAEYAATRTSEVRAERDAAARDLATVVGWLGVSDPEAARQLVRRLPSGYEQAEAKRLLAASLLTGETASARTLLEEAAGDARGLGDAAQRNQALADVAVAFSRLDARRALQLVEEVSDPAKRAYALCTIGLREAPPEQPPASALLRRATDELGKVKNPRQRAYVGYALGRALAGTSDDRNLLLADADAMYFHASPW